MAAKTGTNNSNGATWVLGYTTGMATASFFGDALEGQKRPGTEHHHQRQALRPDRRLHDRRARNGPNYMLKVAKLYAAKAFPKPPASMIGKGAK